MYELQVEGMSCNHCVNAVTKSVQAVDGAARVEVDLPHRKVRVESAADLGAITSAIADAGYPVIDSIER
jgi:copper chaperone